MYGDFMILVCRFYRDFMAIQRRKMLSWFSVNKENEWSRKKLWRCRFDWTNTNYSYTTAFQYIPGIPRYTQTAFPSWISICRCCSQRLQSEIAMIPTLIWLVLSMLYGFPGRLGSWLHFSKLPRFDISEERCSGKVRQSQNRYRARQEDGNVKQPPCIQVTRTSR